MAAGVGQPEPGEGCGRRLCPPRAPQGPARDQGWKFMSRSHGQELGQQASWLLIGYTRVNNQSEARKVESTLDSDSNSKISASGPCLGKFFFL